jgi:hypothetical protein
VLGTTVTHLIEYVTVVLHRGEKTMANQHPAGAAPTARNVTVRSRQPRDYLTPREIERLIEAARGNRWGHRDATFRRPNPQLGSAGPSVHAHAISRLI